MTAPSDRQVSRGGAVPPERTWRVATLYVASGLYTMGDGAVNVLFAPHFQQQGLSETAIGWTMATYGVAALFCRLVLSGTYRAHHAPLVVPAGCLVSAVTLATISQASSAPAIALLIAIKGVGFAVVSTGTLAAVMDIRRGSNAGAVMAWYTGCIGAGYALAGLVGGVAGDVLGVGSALFTLAGLPLLTGVVLHLVLRSFFGDEHPTVGTEEPRPGIGTLVDGLRTAGPAMWIAVFVGVHINLILGVMHTFFPLYGLAIGLTLTQIGLLAGIHSTLGSLIRFVSRLVFRFVPYRRTLPWMVVLGGLCVASMGRTTSFLVLIGLWSVLGLTRGMLRVSSSALAMDASGSSSRGSGAAAGLYMSGLDVGRIFGPVIGGLVTGAVGLGSMLTIVGLAFPVSYLVVVAILRRRVREEVSHQRAD